MNIYVYIYIYTYDNCHYNWLSTMKIPKPDKDFVAVPGRNQKTWGVNHETLDIEAISHGSYWDVLWGTLQ